ESRTEEDCPEKGCCQECGGAGSRQGDEEGGQEERCKEAAERRDEGSRTDCGGGSCRSLGSTPEVWRIAAPTRKFTTILELRLKTTSVCAKNHRRWDDPSSDGLHSPPALSRQRPCR